METLELDFPYLTLPQVLSWVLERDAEQIRQLLETAALAEFAREYVQRRQQQKLNVLAIESPSPNIGKVCWESAPIEEQQRDFLGQENLRLELLETLPPTYHGVFAEVLVGCLRDFHISAGKTFPQAEQLVENDLDKLERWLDGQGLSIPLNKLAKEHARWKADMIAEADKDRQKAEASLISNLAAGRIEAIGLRGGKGHPETIPANWWPLSSFSDRDLVKRGMVPITVLKSDDDETFWTELRFKAHNVFSIWRPNSDDSVTAAACDTAPAEFAELPRSKSSPAKDGARRAIAELFPGGAPDQTVLTNNKLRQRVTAKMKELGLPIVSDDTILRAAGRRK